MANQKIVVLGGGTVSYVRNHMALCAPAYGATAKHLAQCITEYADTHKSPYSVELVLTKMAGGSKLETNSDVAKYVDELIADPTVKGIVFNIALVDFNGQIDDVPSGKYAQRLQSRVDHPVISLTVADKLIGKIRQERKDIFVVGFKTTAGAPDDEQYTKGLRLLKENSLNLVLANDTVTRQNMVIVPEEAIYGKTTNRNESLDVLVKIMMNRISNTFTRSTVVEGPVIPWSSKQVPESLRAVVNHCIQKGAYKPFLGKTAGHFAVKIDESEILTSIRKSNFNNLDAVGLVKITPVGQDTVIAQGARPSVGGQSQRIVFKEHPDLDCIVHFHCPPLDRSAVPVSEQWPYQCGSHECGQNTSRGLRRVDLGAGHSLEVVYLDEHGPNIVFSREVPAQKVIDFIDRTFDLSQKTGGLVG